MVAYVGGSSVALCCLREVYQLDLKSTSIELLTIKCQGCCLAYSTSDSNNVDTSGEVCHLA